MSFWLPRWLVATMTAWATCTSASPAAPNDVVLPVVTFHKVFELGDYLNQRVGVVGIVVSVFGLIWLLAAQARDASR